MEVAILARIYRLSLHKQLAVLLGHVLMLLVPDNSVTVVLHTHIYLIKCMVPKHLL